MLRTVLGRDGFRAGMNLYFERHDGEAATIEDFLACFADATGTDLSQFALWYSQAGTPTITVTHRYEPEKERLTLELRQDLPETPDRMPKKPMHIPIAFGLVGPDGQDLSYRQGERHRRRRRDPSDQGPRGGRVRRRAGAADPLALPRVLRAGARASRTSHRRTACS